MSGPLSPTGLPFDVTALSGLSPADVAKVVTRHASRVYDAADVSPDHPVFALLALSQAYVRLCKLRGLTRGQMDALIDAAFKTPVT